jgi:hypothetical protein
MHAIKAMVRNGRIETDEPLDVPDGTELLIVQRDVDDDWDNTPQGVGDWLKWYDSLQPLIFSAEERDALKADQQARKEWELAHADERAKKLQGLWE